MISKRKRFNISKILFPPKVLLARTDIDLIPNKIKIGNDSKNSPATDSNNYQYEKYAKTPMLQ